MKITANHPSHGLYQASARAVDEAIAKYLPASVEELREKVHERTDVDYSDVDSVSFFLVMLAEWDGVECGASDMSMQWTPAEKGYFCTVDATPIDDGCGKPAVWKLYEDQSKSESYWCNNHKKENQ